MAQQSDYCYRNEFAAMKITIPQEHHAFNTFLTEERSKVISFLRKSFIVDDADLDDIFQNASVALYLNIKEGKLSTLTSSLSTYFLRVCINQTLKFLSQKKKTVPLFDETTVTTKDEFLADKIDTLYNWSTEDLSQDDESYSERIVQAVIDALPETCRNIFLGYYWNNYTTSTIADLFGFANANSVKTQKYKCVSKFKQKYQELIHRHYE